MKTPMRKIGDWAAFILLATGVSMFIWPFGNRHRTARAWVQETGIDLSIWLGLAAVFLVGGLCLLAIAKLPERK